MHHKVTGEQRTNIIRVTKFWRPSSPRPAFALARIMRLLFSHTLTPRIHRATSLPSSTHLRWSSTMSINSSGSASSPASTYPRPETLLTTTPVHPRPLAPIRPPAAHSELILEDQWIRANPLSQFLPSWTRSTHVIPSAAPRSFAYGTRENFVDGESKEDRRVKSNAIAQSLISRKVSQESEAVVPGAVPEGAQPNLANVLDRYVRQDGPEGPSNGGVTLFLAHANGFPRRVSQDSSYAKLTGPER